MSEAKPYRRTPAWIVWAGLGYLAIAMGTKELYWLICGWIILGIYFIGWIGDRMFERELRKLEEEIRNLERLEELDKLRKRF